MSGVRAELALPLEQRGYDAAAIARAVEEAALELGVAHLLDRRTDTLSGGELQRVALAAAVAGKPSLLVLDEPTSQLDPVAGDDLVWLLRRLNEEWGTAVLLAEHRLERCLAAADRVLVMDGGRVALDAAPAEFLDWAARAAVGAGHAGGAAVLARRASGRRPCRSRRRATACSAAGLAPAVRAPGVPATPRVRLAAGTGAALRGRLARDRRRARDPARGRPRAAARRAGRADGAQRRGQEHAAAPREGAGRADARARSRARAGSRCCCRTPATS